jgi:hypothetical protein
VQNLFSSLAGGQTTLNASGGWFDENHAEIRDKSRIVVTHLPITKWTEAKTMLISAINIIQIMGKQKCVFLTVNQLSWGPPINLLNSGITDTFPEEPGPVDQHLEQMPDTERRPLEPALGSTNITIHQTAIGNHNTQIAGDYIHNPPGLTKEDLDSSLDLDKRVANLEVKLAALSLPDPTTTGMKEVEVTPEQEAKIHEILEEREELDEMGATLDPWAKITLGNMYFHLTEFDTAITYYQMAKLEFQINGDGVGIAISLGNLGAIAQTRGELDESERLYRESIVIKKEVGIPLYDWEQEFDERDD